MNFLEEKRIIDPKNYENEREAQKLIKDLMKLDLEKFNKDISKQRMIDKEKQ